MKSILETIVIQTICRETALNVIAALKDEGYCITPKHSPLTPSSTARVLATSPFKALNDSVDKFNKAIQSLSNPRSVSESLIIEVPESDEGVFKPQTEGVSDEPTVEGGKFCYQCDKCVDFLFHDSRCADCTSLTQNELGEGVYD